MKHNNLSVKVSLRKQKGIATILLVVLIGVALIATSFGVMHSIRGTQEQQVAAHASTHAQTGVWTGVESFRRFLGSIDVDTLEALDDVNGAVYTVSLAGIGEEYGTITVSDLVVANPINGAYQVSATITNVHAQANASASVGAVFQIMPEPPTVELDSALNFYDNLSATGQINLDTTQKINVDGNINFENINISALESLSATGSINLDSGVQVQRIHSNGDVTLSGSAAVAEIQSQGNVTTKVGSSATVDFIKADGNVNLGASGRTLSVDSLSTITAKAGGGNHTLLRTGGSVIVEQTVDDYGNVVKYGNTISNIYSVGLIDVQSADATVTNVYGKGDLDCPASEWTKYTSIQLSGQLDDSCTHQKGKLEDKDPSVLVPTPVTVEVMDPVPEFSLPSLRIDVFKLRADANYIVTYENGRITVTVNNIRGETNGTVYQLGNYEGDINKPDALCSAVNGAGNCMCSNKAEGVCQDPENYLCVGSSANGSCIDYQDGVFTISGTGVAPGIYWFDGDVHVATGFNNATMLVTGNIFSSGQYRGAAVNYGYEPVVNSIGNRKANQRTTPYQEICLVEATGLKEAMNHMVPVYKTRFSQRYPTNLCDLDAETYTGLPTGNLALAAGGIRPTEEGGNGSYGGGDIKIGSNSQVYGITMAGGYFESGGGATFFGYVAAAVQGQKRASGATKNLLSGNTNLILNTATDDYQPNSTADMSPPGAGPVPDDSQDNSRLLWSRYL